MNKLLEDWIKVCIKWYGTLPKAILGIIYTAFLITFMIFFASYAVFMKYGANAPPQTATAFSILFIFWVAMGLFQGINIAVGIAIYGGGTLLDSKQSKKDRVLKFFNLKGE